MGNIVVLLRRVVHYIAVRFTVVASGDGHMDTA